MSRHWRRTLVCLVAILLVVGGGTAYADSEVPLPIPGPSEPDNAGKYPVPYNLAQGLIVGSLQPHGEPPGSNDFGCRPSRAHPRPVILIHGGVTNKNNNWQTLAPLLANRGFCVFAVDYGKMPGAPYPADQIGGTGSLEDAAYLIRDFVAEVRKATGANQVDLVGHSFGTLMPQYYLRFLGGAAEIDKFVAIAGLPAGDQPYTDPVMTVLNETDLYGPGERAISPSCGYCIQAPRNSGFMRHLNGQPGGPAVPGVSYTTLVTRYDEKDVPYTLGQLPAGPNVTNIVTQDGCEIDLSDHLAIVATRRTGQIVLNALDPGHATRPPCDPVLPTQGSDLVPFVPTSR